MKKMKYLLCSVSVLLLMAGCKNQVQPPTEKMVPADTSVVSVIVTPDTETKLLLDELVKNGDYVNSNNFPSLIKASIVNEELGRNNLIIDIRSKDKYSAGHIKGSVNKRFEDLPEYLQSGIRPFEYDRIIVVDDDGALSSYTVSLLRLMGYGNIYAMRWGMSAWNKEYADKGWLSGVSGKYESALEKNAHDRVPGTSLPLLKTGFTSGSDIAAARYKKLFGEGTGNVIVSAEEVFSDPSKYYIINFERKDKYEDGHIPGAVRYKPESTLGYVEEMASIPIGKTVVVYCGTGHNSGFATAYLRLFGYDARTLRYGNNSFMYDKMNKDRKVLSWLPFTAEEVNDFEVVK